MGGAVRARRVHAPAGGVAAGSGSDMLNCMIATRCPAGSRPPNPGAWQSSAWRAKLGVTSDPNDQPRRTPLSRSHLHRFAAACSATTLVLFAGCDLDDDDDVIVEPDPPRVENLVAEINATNALSMQVSFTSSRVESARLIYWIDPAEPHTTPNTAITGSETTLTALGLLPDTEYSFVVEGEGEEEIVTSAAVTARSGTLPDDLADVRFEFWSGEPTGRYLLTSVDRRDYILVFDGLDGRLVWYRYFEGQDGALTATTETGNYLAFVGSTRGWDPTFGYFVEVRPDGELVRTYAANPPLYTDNHELLVTVDESGFRRIHYFSYDIRPYDMSPFGGSADAMVAGHQLLRYDGSGNLEYMWNAWDHFEVSDWEVAIPSPDNCFSCDFDHPNSLAIDHDGNYVVSFRSLNEITWIDPRFGEVLYRLGGKNNQFTFVNDPLDGFSGQHMATVMPSGNILLFDNGPNHDPPVSRAVEYDVDFNAMTATLVWSYDADPAIHSAFRCSAQRLEDGNTLVGYSTGEVHEADASGAPVWVGTAMVGDEAPGFYRVIKIDSLYLTP